ncbi:MAG: hypothetical protein ACN6OP_18885 [Pseudomonadales bacterium]
MTSGGAMADVLPVPSRVSTKRRRLLLSLAVTPIAGVALRVPSALPCARAAVPALVGVDLASRMDISATHIRLFDAAGRLRVVVGCFDPSP